MAGLSLVVDTVVDESDGNYAAGDFSLRQAIGLANGSIGANTITFAASLTSGGAVGIFLTKGELAISDAVMINGPAPNLLVINALAQSRVINITANTGDFTISGLTLTGGKTTGNKLNSSDTTYEARACVDHYRKSNAQPRHRHRKPYLRLRCPRRRH